MLLRGGVHARRIAILGAGICGLAIAWHLKQLDPKLQLTLIEKSDRAGGWIQTVQMDGFLFDQGPKSIRTRGAGVETLRLIQSLGLEGQVIVPSKDAASRFVYDGKGLQALPKHLYQIPAHPLTSGWIKALWRDWQAPKREVEDESISAFFSRRIGEEWVDRLIDPFVLGIFAGDCRRLSLKSCFPQFDEWEREEGSLFRGHSDIARSKQMKPPL